MQFKTVSSPHKASASSVNSVMMNVIYALVPGTIAMIYYFGWGIFFNLLLAITTAIICEALILVLRKRPVFTTLTDGSALVTAWLLALALPALAPWWLPVVGVSFAIVFGKHIYGGLGYNPFNPAMVGYVVLLISFPVEMTQWLLPSTLQTTSIGFTDALQMILASDKSSIAYWDAITSATPLDSVKTGLGLSQSLEQIHTQTIFSYIAGTGWEWIGIWYLLGGIWLLFRKIITWHTPVATLASLFIIASLFQLIDPASFSSGVFHIFSGAAILGAFFIATDPVSACTSNKGKIIYGFGIGALTYIIRTWGGYPDAIAFSVLLMNMSAPMIDYYTKPRTFGHSKKLIKNISIENKHND